MEFCHERWKSGLLHFASDFDPTNQEINFIGETLFQFKKKSIFRPTNLSRHQLVEEEWYRML